MKKYDTIYTIKKIESFKAKKRKSNCSYGTCRELPGGVRQPKKNSELASEQPAEDREEDCVGADGVPAVKGERHVSAGECMAFRHEIEWYRVNDFIASL